MAAPDAGGCSRRYDLNGLKLSVEADRPAFARFLDFALAPLGASDATPPDIHVRLEGCTTLPPVPTGMVQWDGSLPGGLDSTLVRVGEVRTLHVPPYYQATFERERNSARILVGVGGERWLSGALAFWLIDEI